MSNQIYTTFLDGIYSDKGGFVCIILNTYSHNESYTYRKSGSLICGDGSPVIERYDNLDKSVEVKDFYVMLDTAIDLLSTYLTKLEMAPIKETVDILVHIIYLFKIKSDHEGNIKYGGFPTYQKYLNSDHWKRIRQGAIDRASSRCMLCNDNKATLHVHHRTYERLGHEQPEDVIVLCRTHHAQFHGKDGAK